MQEREPIDAMKNLIDITTQLQYVDFFSSLL